MKEEERLTENRVYSRLEFIGYGMATLYNRLAEYENTGLSPKEVDKLKKENAELKLQNETLTSCLEYEKDGRMKYQEELSKIPYCVETCKRCDYLKINAELKARLRELKVKLNVKSN